MTSSSSADPLVIDGARLRLGDPQLRSFGLAAVIAGLLLLLIVRG